jgi:hypothetical protein
MVHPPDAAFAGLGAKLDRLTRSLGDWDRIIADYFGERTGRIGDSSPNTTSVRLVNLRPSPGKSGLGRGHQGPLSGCSPEPGRRR